MPLDKSDSKSSIGNNIKTEIASGKPKKQVIAIALNIAGKSKKKNSPPGILKHRKDMLGE
jgi:hypothetical protein